MHDSSSYSDARPPRVLVVGAGAVGSVLAASLWRAGVPVEVLTKPVQAAEAAARDGLSVGGVGFETRFAARPTVTAQAGDLQRPDCVFLATKALHVAGALEEIGPKLGTQSIVVVMQNGYCEEEVAEIVGPERVVSCTVRWGATLASPTRSVRTSAGGFTIGRLQRAGDGVDETLLTVAGLLETCAPVRVTPNVLGARYSKLVLNACMTTIGAVTGLRLRDILARPAGREMFIRAATEGVRTFRALGVRLEHVDGLNLSWLCVEPGRKWPELRRARAEFALRVLRLLRGGILSSSLQSLRRGERTEIDYLNGYIVRKAREVGLDAPVNALLAERVHEIERGEREIGPHNLGLHR